MFLLSFNLDTNTSVILTIAIMLFIAFLVTRITKRFSLPNVTAYILAGILIGPHVLNLIPESVIGGMEFLTDLALALIAFGVGRYLKLSALRENSAQTVIITLFESLLAGAVITLSMYFIFRIPLPLALMLGAIASATAPASTIMTIRQYGAKGPFVNMILQVVALDDAVALVAFSVVAAVIQATIGGGTIEAAVIILPILLNLAAILLGVAFGFLLNRMINDKRTADNRLLLSIATISALAGFCAAFGVSPLLACMALGTAYINISGNTELFDQVNDFAPVILTMFFVLSGMRLNVPALKTAGIVGVGYFFIRILAKYAGAYLGAAASGASRQIKKYLGLALIPQAGVSIGLAILGQRLLPAEMGSMLSTIILSSAVLYEMVGPASGKLALHLSGAIPSEKAKKEEQPDASGEELPPEPRLLRASHS